MTFQDGALLVANSGLTDTLVYRAIKLLFSNKGLAYLRNVDPAASDMAEATGLTGISVPLHPGAELYWRERQRVNSGR